MNLPSRKELIVEPPKIHFDEEGRPHSPGDGSPAVSDKSGFKAWCWHGQLHRTSGPARIHGTGMALEYALYGFTLAESEFKQVLSLANDSGINLDMGPSEEVISIISRFRARYQQKFCPPNPI